jgi:uncharacterized protein (DUF362 family)
MDRREFCQLVTAMGGSAAIASLLQACKLAAEPTPTAEPISILPLEPTHQPTPPEPTLVPTSTPSASEQIEIPDQPDSKAEPSPTTFVEPTLEPTMAAVSLVKTTDRATGVQRALSLLGINAFTGRQVLLKPNFNSADPAPGSTHPDTLRALLMALQEMGAGAITVGDRSGMGNTRNVMEQLGLFELANSLGVDVAVFDELTAEEWTIVKPRDSHWSVGFPVPNLLLKADCIVQTCNLKTHQYGGHFTLSLKNSVGFVARTVGDGGHNYMSELHDSSYQRHMIAEINSVYRPDLVVMDGVEAFVDGGPAKGTVAQSEVILASRDRIAIDATGVAILRMFGTTPEVSEGPIFGQAQIARAVELGLGIETPSQINFITEDAASEAYANSIRAILTG